jgi:NADH:ubiquinone oxidoreductase subunit F (NADH-binding)
MHSDDHSLPGDQRGDCGAIGSEPADVASFYHLEGVDLSSALCQGTACFAAQHLNPSRWRAAVAQPRRVHCLGKCYLAPAAAMEESRPAIEVRSRLPVVLERIVQGGAPTLDQYRRQAGWQALERAARLGPRQVIDEIEASELRGRGGAGFPTGPKWRAAAAHDSDEKFIVANFDEGDPGAYVDRFIAEDDPYSLLEGMLIAARAVGASRGWIYARCEYPRAIQSLQRALAEARAAGMLGPDGPQAPSFEIELVVGRGSYECGEETSLLNSIEGKRPVARVRPPYVAEQGLWGRPTVVNNVETLACVPWILRNGARQFASLGIPGSRGTKVVSLNSLFRRPGLYEIEFGVSLRDIVEELGGGLQSGELRALMIGGPLAGVVPPSLLDTRFGFDELRTVGAAVGHGGVIAFDEHTTIADLIHHAFTFAAYESCGKCTPCRLGAPRIEAIFRQIRGGSGATVRQRAEWNDIVAALKLASLCGLGTGLAEFAESLLRHFPAEVEQCFA